MKTLSVHIQESFAPITENQQIVVEYLNDNQENVVNDNIIIENEKPSE